VNIAAFREQLRPDASAALKRETAKKLLRHYIPRVLSSVCVSAWRLDRARFIEPCLPFAAPQPPAGSNWIHESSTTGFGSWPGGIRSASG
jgi:hypothetical protein